jgi:uncharacterized protein (TIGR03437 family)
MFTLERFRILVLGLLPFALPLAQAQISTSAYRVLGQTDLLQDGVNLVQGVELYSPAGVAVDARGGQVHIYISDSLNSRVLAWQDAQSYQIGDPPTLVLGQPGPQYSKPYGIGSKGFNAPLGMAVDSTTGNLYVADTGNNRVLRFPAPFSNPSRAEPDAVYGQPGFTTLTAGTTKGLMSAPRALAFDSGGNLWVADTGNNRVLRFSASLLNSLTPPDADTVIGQKDFFSGAANSGGPAISGSGFSTPAGLVFDQQDNLYVSDFNNARVLKFSAPLGPTVVNPVASDVIGQPGFVTGAVSAQTTNATLAGPAGLSVDSSGNLYVTDPGDNRVLVFPLKALSNGAQTVFGQSDFASTTANVGVFPSASPNTLYAPADVKLDASGNLYVADTGNNRVLGYSGGSKSATRVWGQSDFSGNGPNQVKATGMSAPSRVAIDYSQSPYALYVSDTANHRILVWKDAVHFRNGDPADLVIGQPDFRTAIPNVDTRGSLTATSTSLSSPMGIAVQPNTGSLFVADSGNNRVLRFPRPVNQVGRITADAVIGQVDFASALSALVTASSLRGPRGLAFGPDGDLFVADTGNNRVLEFASINRPAVRVYGQPNFTSSGASALVSAQTLTAPQGLAVDTAFNLYVADTGANRVLIFPNTQSAPPAGMSAGLVIGQSRFDSTAGGGTFLRSPTDVSLDSSADIYIADYGDNRVLEFQSFVFLPAAGATATAVVGQNSLTGTAANWDSPDGLTTPEGLFGPAGVYLDRQDTLYVADAGNSRVVHFLKPASVVSAATYQPSVPVAGGSLAALFGNGMVTASGNAPTTASAPGAPWPTNILNRQVVVNDQTPSPIYYISPTQINFQVPALAPTGSDRIAVRLADTGELIAGGAMLVSANSPGLFTSTQNGLGQAAALNQDTKINGTNNPAARGSVLVLYGTGQGQVSPLVPDGVAAPSSPFSNTVAIPTSDGKTCATSQPSMCVAIGTSFGNIQYSGLAPGYIGLWQINVTIPSDVTPGSAVPVRVVINGALSNTVTVAVQ